jgi:phosphate transport system protein
MTDNRQEFDRQLDEIEAKVIELFAMVAQDIPEATGALLTGDTGVLATLTERERAIDALYPEVEVLASKEILLQSPVAADLRFLLTVLRIVPEIERSHDLVMEIASQANHVLGGDLSPRLQGLVRRMGDLTSGMWRQAADAWYQRDSSVAGVLAERDEEMDSLYASLTAELASGVTAIPVAMEMTLAGHAYERLGAHAVNICRRVIYLAGTAPRKNEEGDS